MTKILGIDTGTNSLGWAIVEKKAEQYCLLDKGVNIFQKETTSTRTTNLPKRQKGRATVLSEYATIA